MNRPNRRPLPLNVGITDRSSTVRAFDDQRQPPSSAPMCKRRGTRVLPGRVCAELGSRRTPHLAGHVLEPRTGNPTPRAQPGSAQIELRDLPASPPPTRTLSGRRRRTEFAEGGSFLAGSTGPARASSEFFLRTQVQSEHPPISSPRPALRSRGRTAHHSAASAPVDGPHNRTDELPDKVLIPRGAFQTRLAADSGMVRIQAFHST